MKVPALGIAFLLASALCFGQGFDDETRMAIVLWSPEDIEEFAVEIASQGTDLIRENGVINGVLKFQEMSGINLGWLAHIKEEVVMRRVAYGVLKYWPDSKKAVQVHQYGERSLNHLSPVYGKDLLRIFWHNWSRAWNRLWRDFIDTSDVRFQRNQVAKFEQKWGKWDAEDPPHKIPSGYLPEETDGIWYLAIDSEEHLLLKTVMEKRGGLLGEWSNENTRVISYYAKHGDSFAGPFPDPVVFFFHPSNNQLKITTYFHFNLRRTLKSTGYVDVSWKAKLPWARLVRKNMNTVERSRLSFETHYPVYDWDDNQWVYLPVKVSAVKFQEWQAGLDHVRSIQNMSREEIGAMLRAWAGPYSVE
jgi:hypothetical protein